GRAQRQRQWRRHRYRRRFGQGLSQRAEPDAGRRQGTTTGGRRLISETRRRAYVVAMQVASRLPRPELRVAAPSRPERLQRHTGPGAEPAQPIAAAATVAEGPAGQAAASTAPAVRPETPQLRVVMPEPKKPEPVAAPEVPAEQQEPVEPPPR